ncbi:MAG: 2-oxo acid dehydrogenase subunit E2 [Acidobacteria bacterium]|nr:2-oxo acid dehydrogenase subunit E2 [Acidobacteriota bacterium]
MEFKLPELGENVTAGDVLRVLVAPGDQVKRDQPVLELETDKATIEVPSSVAGVVQEVKVKAGDKITVGQTILIADDSGSTKAAPAPAAQKPAEQRPAARPGPAAPEPERPAPTQEHVERAARRARETGEAPEAGTEDTAGGPSEDVPEPPSRRGSVVDIRAPRITVADQPPASSAEPAAAAPSVRRLARELGVDINDIPGTGPTGRISTEDVKAYTRWLVSRAGSASEVRAEHALPDFSRWGEIERVAMKGVRRKTAEHLSQAWAAIPHVTQHDRADITELEEFRRRHAPMVESSGGALTITVIALKIVASALKVFPQFNSSVDMAAEEIVLKKYVNIGVAVDTDRGLLVPVIRDVDRKNLTRLSIEVAQAAARARARKTSLDEMEGGSFTITNLGGIGGTGFSPIVNWPEVAILGLARASTMPVFQNGELKPRPILPLSLSYDHRVIDGADAVRFIRRIADSMEQPLLLALEG